MADTHLSRKILKRLLLVLLLSGACDAASSTSPPDPAPSPEPSPAPRVQLTVSGQITSAADGQPISGVRVILERCDGYYVFCGTPFAVQDETTSDAEGGFQLSYEITRCDHWQHRFTVYADGYEYAFRYLECRDGEQRFDIELIPIAG